ncbi:MAG: hypothetical protein BIFFINMI_03852 [Phycisphaerae bacterium]|nr:hypothetical protein [Phycisphaerae bacterium]
MKIKLLQGDLRLAHLRTRMPFRYGIAVMTELPHAFVRVTVDIAGRRQTGLSADHLPPRWFTKDPSQSPADEIAAMRRVIARALDAAAGREADSVFDLWRDLYADQDRWASAENVPPLLAHFGTSLVERALIDAACRAAGQPFHAMVRSGGLGVRLGTIRDELAGVAPADLLPARPLPSVVARHTVGLGDPLTDADIPADQRLDDGLPQSLAACIARYGLRHFKIKLGGQAEADLQRLARTLEVIAAGAGPDFAFSLDGNEQFRSVEPLRAFWDLAREQPAIHRHLGRLLFVEQPIARDRALAFETGEALLGWADRPPIIIDESDATLDALPRALSLGYAGTSHKNCKGVFKGLVSRCHLRLLERQGRRVVSSGEDLCNIGPVALLQDLAVMAALGIESVERNGHHYFAGLSMWPDQVGRQVLDAHGDLYAATPAGWPAAMIRGGRMELGTVNAAALGCGFELDVEAFTEDAT